MFVMVFVPYRQKHTPNIYDDGKVGTNEKKRCYAPLIYWLCRTTLSLLTVVLTLPLCPFQAVIKGTLNNRYSEII